MTLPRPLLLGLALFLCASAAASAHPTDDPVPGGVAVVPLGAAEQAPAAWYGEQRVLVQSRDGEWVALVGLPLEVKPGAHRLRVTGADGTSARVEFSVTEREYATQHLTIKNRRMVNPNAEDLERIRREQVEIRTALATWDEAASAQLGFVKPVDGRYSSPFGLRRFFNGEPRRPHSGLDIAAPEGAPIRAPAAGRVLVVGDYFFNGKTVFLDHGQGLVSMFSHMSEIAVVPGEQVAQGQLLGAVGMTGRVTGPHLHWGVSLNNARVNPRLFIVDEVAEAE